MKFEALPSLILGVVVVTRISMKMRINSANQSFRRRRLANFLSKYGPHKQIIIRKRQTASNSELTKSCATVEVSFYANGVIRCGGRLKQLVTH